MSFAKLCRVIRNWFAPKLCPAKEADILVPLVEFLRTFQVTQGGVVQFEINTHHIVTSTPPETFNILVTCSEQHPRIEEIRTFVFELGRKYSNVGFRFSYPKE